MAWEHPLAPERFPETYAVWSFPGFVGGVLPTDCLGNIWYVDWLPDLATTNLCRLDPATGGNAALSTATLSPDEPFLQFSPQRDWAYAAGNLWDVNPSQIDPALPDQPLSFAAGCASGSAFIDGDFYCGYADVTDGEGKVLRVDAAGVKHALYAFTGTVSFVPILGDRSPQLLLSLTPDGGTTGFALLDTQSLLAISLPMVPVGARFLSASDDGHWLLFQLGPTDNQTLDAEFILVDWTTGRNETLDAALLGRAIGNTLDWPSVFAEWRPGHDELWFPVLPSGFAVWKPDGSVGFFPGTLAQYAAEPRGVQSTFTSDGRSWFSKRADQPGRVAVGSADDPAAPVFFLNPVGTGTLDYWPLDDGRLLVEAAPIDTLRSDIYLEDPATGGSRTLASLGHVVALGHTRFLALLDWEPERSDGSLTLVDMASGNQTVFAQNVYAVAVDRGGATTVPPGTDALASGTRIAYLTRGRLESPYDGLWLAELP